MRESAHASASGLEILNSQVSTPDGLGTSTAAAVVRGSLWSIAGNLIPQAQILGLSIVAANYLGPDGLGRQSYIAFTALSLVLLATAGLPSTLSRFVAELLGAREGGVALALFAWTRRVMLPAAAISAATMVLLAALGAEPNSAWVLAGIGSALAVLQAAPNALLLGAQRWRDASIAGLITAVASVPATTAVLAAGGGITGFFAVETGVLAVNLAWTWVLARRLLLEFPPAAPPAPELRKRFYRAVAMATVTVAIEFVVWRRSEFLVLGRVSSDSQLAFYSIAFALTWGLSRIPGVVAAVTMPAIATLFGAGEVERVRSGFWRAARLLLIITPPLTAAAAAAGPALIRLAYGDAFEGAGDPLLVLLIPLPILPLLLTSASLLFALGRMRFLLVAGLAATVVNITLAVTLIPSYDALGASIANAGSQLFAGLPAFVLACRLLRPVDLGWKETAGAFAAALAGGLAAALCVHILGGLLGICCGLALGFAVWTAAMVVLRPFRAADARWLGTALGPRASALALRICG
jgi:O-antigen/teichoic acid export membrane protein